jgi:hypothetical protein
MTTKDRLHELVDELPEGEIAAAVSAARHRRWRLTDCSGGQVRNYPSGASTRMLLRVAEGIGIDLLSIQVPEAFSPAVDPALRRGPWRWVTAHPLLAVVLLTYALTWIVLVPIALESHGWLPFSVPSLAVLVAAWGPLIAAVIVVASLGGRRGVRAYFGRLLIWLVPAYCAPAWPAAPSEPTGLTGPEDGMWRPSSSRRTALGCPPARNSPDQRPPAPHGPRSTMCRGEGSHAGVVRHVWEPPEARTRNGRAGRRPRRLLRRVP